MPEKIPYAVVRPSESLDLLSNREMAALASANHRTHRLFRQCALAVLNTGGEVDDAWTIYRQYHDFDLKVVAEPRGVKIELYNAPASAFVDGVLIRGIRSHLFTILRDIVFTEHKLVEERHFDLGSGQGITDAVFRILRNAKVVRADLRPNLVVCWGGHAIPREEYDFSKEVGYRLGLRLLDVATGCGAGAMKGPMKGATLGHAKQQYRVGRYVGISEPGIIAVEPPNPIVNELVVLPDIEKRLEAFVRLAHSIVIFPGGVGTAEELLYLIGLKMHPDNVGKPFPVILAAPETSPSYFLAFDRFIHDTLGDEATRHYEIVSGGSDAVAKKAQEGVEQVQKYRRKMQESYSFNWCLTVPEGFQQPFVPTHENMAALNFGDKTGFQRAAELRKMFSGIVAGNVKEFGIRAVREKGPYELSGDPAIMMGLDKLLRSFVAEGRMKLDAAQYQPCYRIV